MANLWLVARHEYRQTVARRGFVILTLAIPLGIAAMIAAIIAIGQMNRNTQPLGYVDEAGFLNAALASELPNATERIQILSFPDVSSAQAALEGNQIQAFFVFPPDYPQSLKTDLYYRQSPPDQQVWQDMDDLVRLNLTSSLPAAEQQRLLAGPQVTVHDLGSGRQFSEEGIVNIILPFVATFFFLFATMSASGYMLSVVAKEKENRTIEIVLTSMTPTQLIGGKALGLLAASLTQLGVYVLAALIGIELAASSVPELRLIAVPWDYIGVMVLFFFPAYALIGGLMIAIGSAVTEVQQGQQVAGLLNLLFVVPLFVTPLLFENPSQPLMVAMTLFPTTSFLTVSLRWGLGTIPLWQLAASWLLLVSSALAAIWAAARIVRAGMLRYGQPLSLQSVVSALRRG